ncbi:MAG TPA: DUF805 domain-containing protein, partial [Propionibacteriaceae bacterium]|nr:DUF805 domain-containing protein [Propionibacteriaceae bacterium]
MSSNPYGQGPGQSGSYEDYSQGYAGAPQTPYGQQSPQAPYGQPQDPYSQPSTPGYSQPSASDYGQPSGASYGQSSYTQPSSYGQSSTPQYAQSDYATTYPQSNYQQPTYGQSDPYGQPYTQQFAPSGYGQQYGQGLAPYAPTYDSTPRPSVTMGQAVRLWLKNWKNFSGRASRSEYWWVFLALGILSTVLMIVFVGLMVAAAVATSASSGSDAAMAGFMFLMWGVLAIVGIATFIPSLSLGIRRLHDANFSGWLYLLSFIPSVGGI